MRMALRRSCRGMIVAVAGWIAMASGGWLGAAPGPTVGRIPTHVRQCVVWIGRQGIDVAESDLLARAGVDRLALRVGEVDLAGDVPVVKLYPEVPLGGELPVSIVVRIGLLRPKLDPNAAIPVWGVLRDSLGPGRKPAGIILDIPEVKVGFERFVANLARVSRVPVVPLVTSAQLHDPGVLAVIRAAGSCCVLAYGSVGMERRGAVAPDLPLGDQLAPLGRLGIRPRVAFALRPEIRPPLPTWGQDIDPLTNPAVADISIQTEFDRRFTFRRSFDWSGQSWHAGESVELRWMDASRLDAGLHEACTVMLPEVVGWDLITLPPPGDVLGISREALLRYLRGEGPTFEPEVSVQRRGRNLRVTLSNPSPFGSAVSVYGSWVQVTVDRGSLVAGDRGTFDRIALGTVRPADGGEWHRLAGAGGASAVRFYETYVAPEEAISSGTVRLPSSRSRVTVRWTVLLGTGRELQGTLR